ncbi:MAG: UDP-N-acetylmuramate dehydrogenase [Bacilli bacterium]|nr:UDP-N-acetylmuramate dehydrogenase [Bacilli bacterium]
MDIISMIKKTKIGKILENVPMSEHTTYKVGGKATIVFPKNIEKLIQLIKLLEENKINFKILGNGSNVIFKDSDYEGIIINLKEFKEINIEGFTVRAGAGVNLMELAYKTSRLGLTGLEFATGIPGTLGGAIYMNAGAYKSDMGYIVSEIRVLTPDLKIMTLYNKDLNFHYRTSFLKENLGYICLEAKLILKYGNKVEIKKVIEDRKQKRWLSQPLEYPCAGSVFRNPENDFAGRLIEECNLKGKIIGGAMISSKHANFIINHGNATAKDIKDLIKLAQKEVKNKFNIDLHLEQEIIE